MNTITEAKQYLKDNYKNGIVCPCCNQFTKIYRRPITSAMAYGLILFTKHCQKSVPFNEYTHIENFFKSIPNLPASIRGDFPKLRYWGLIEMGEHGYYRLTNQGVSFTDNNLNVPSHILLYNNKFYGFEGEDVNIQKCLKNKFDYKKLMEGKL